MLMRMSEAIDTQREILSNVLDAHLSLVSKPHQRNHEELDAAQRHLHAARLRYGFFGQNFTHLPFDNAALMWVGLGTCLLVPAQYAALVQSRKWL